MPRASIDYMNARRQHMHARSGGSFQDWAPQQAPIDEIDPIDRTELECESAWSDYRIAADAMWQQIFERFGILRAELVDEIPF